MPPFSNKTVDASLEDTAQSNLCLIFISSSMKKFTVLPVPIPRIVSFVNLDSICSIVASATLLFKSFWSIFVMFDALKVRDGADA